MRPVHLLHLTDPHLFADEAREIYGVNTARSLRRVLHEALAGNRPRPQAIVVTGDIGDDMTSGSYRNFRDALQGCGVPVLCLPGNHDAPNLMAELLDSDGFQYCGRAIVGDWGLVMVDTHVPGDACGRVAAPGLQRLDEDLAAFRDRPVLVCLHHPPISIDSAWLDAVGLANAAEFLAVLDRHPQVRATLGGHVHQAVDELRGSVRVMATPSTCAQFTPRTVTCVMDRRPPGYRWFSLHPDGTLETEVAWLRDWDSASRRQ
jgi:Icc protein